MNAKRLFSISMFVATLLALGVFSRYMSGIAESDHLAVFSVDLSSYYTAARLSLIGEAQQIYGGPAGGFFVTEGRFADVARDAGFAGTPNRYIYLPLFALFFMPLALFSFAAAAKLWLAINLLVLAAVVGMQVLLTRGLGSAWQRTLIALSVNLCCFPLLYGLKLGQTSIVVYAGLCLVALLTQRRAYGPAGGVLGLLICMKWSPALMLIYFILAGRWKVLASVAATVAGLILVSIAMYGMPLHVEYLHVLKRFAGSTVAAWSNQSIDAVLLRHMSGMSPLDFNLIRPPLPVAAFKYVMAAAMLIYAVRQLHVAARSTAPDMVVNCFSALAVCYLLLPGISWLHYYCIAGLPVVQLLCRAAVRVRAWQALGIAALWALVALPPWAVQHMLTDGSAPLGGVLVSLPFCGAYGLVVILLSVPGGRPEKVSCGGCSCS